MLEPHPFIWSEKQKKTHNFINFLFSLYVAAISIFIGTFLCVQTWNVPLTNWIWTFELVFGKFPGMHEIFKSNRQTQQEKGKNKKTNGKVDKFANLLSLFETNAFQRDRVFIFNVNTKLPTFFRHLDQTVYFLFEWSLYNQNSR